MAPGFPRPVRQLPVTSNPVPGPSCVPSSLAPRHVSCSHVESLSSGRGLTNRLHSDTPPSGVDKFVSLKEMKSEDRVRKANRWLACTECVWDISGVLAPLRGQSIDLVSSLITGSGGEQFPSACIWMEVLGVFLYDFIRGGSFVRPACAKLIRGSKE